MAKTKVKKNNKAKPAKKVTAKKAAKKAVSKGAIAKKKVTPVKKTVPKAVHAKKTVGTGKQQSKKPLVKAHSPAKGKHSEKKHERIQYVAVEPKSTSIQSRQSKPAAGKTVAKESAGAKPVLANKAKSPEAATSAPRTAPAGADKNNALRRAALKPLPKQVTPVKLGEIPDYKPEMPAIMKRDVVRQPANQQKEDNRNRYSEKELAEFKHILIDKLDQAKKDYELLKNTLCHTDDHGTDDTSPTFKMLEDGSEVLTREETAQLALRQEKFIQNLQNALIRIENKTYGICRVTGKLIPKERLRRVPHATLSIDAKLEQQYNA